MSRLVSDEILDSSSSRAASCAGPSEVKKTAAPYLVASREVNLAHILIDFFQLLQSFAALSSGGVLFVLDILSRGSDIIKTYSSTTVKLKRKKLTLIVIVLNVNVLFF